MEDLFGHRIRPIMPKTRAVEDHMYHKSPADQHDYRGIKDTSFGLEDFEPALKERGYLKSHTGPIEVLGAGVPKIDPYTYESISSNCRRIRKPSFEDITALTKLSADQFQRISSKVPNDFINMTPSAFTFLRDSIATVSVLTETFIDDVLEATSELCSTEFDVQIALTTFTQVSEKLGSLCDEVLVEHNHRVNECYHVGGKLEGQLYMGQEDFEACMLSFSESLARTGNYEKDVLNVSCKVQNIIGHCIRIEREYNQFTPVGRVSKGKLSRFAKDVEKVLFVLDRYTSILLETCNFVNIMVGLNNK